MNHNNLPLSAMDIIPEIDGDALKITAIVKRNSKVIGYEIAGEFITSEKAIELAERGKLLNIGVAHNKDTLYLKTIPNSNQNDNLSNLPVKNI